MIESCNVSPNQVNHNSQELYCRSDESTYANETQLLFLATGIIGTNYHHRKCTVGVTDSDGTMRYVITQSESLEREDKMKNHNFETDIETDAAIVIQKAYRSFKNRQSVNIADWEKKYRKLNFSVDHEDQDSINYIEFWDQSEGQRSPYSLATNSNSVTDSKDSDYIDIDVDNNDIDDLTSTSEPHTDIADIIQPEEFLNEHIYDSIPFDLASPPDSPLKEELPRSAMRGTHHAECPLSRRKHSGGPPMVDNGAHSVIVCEQDLLNRPSSNLYVVRSGHQPVVMTVNENCPTHRIVHNNVSVSPLNHARGATLTAYNQCSMLAECRATIVRPRLEPFARHAMTAHQQQQQQSRILHDQKIVYQKRMYRVGLNLFNKNPVVGINYLIKNQFIKPHPSHIAKFLLTKNGISRNAVGDYIGLLSDPLALQVTKYFLRRINMKNKEVDEALRSFIYYVHLPGESQKISHLMEEFKDAYTHQNERTHFKSVDTIMVLAYAIIMLQTDAHNLSIKKNEKMTLDQFINNLRGVDENSDIDRNILEPIYARVTGKEIKTMPDHTDQVRRLNEIICGNNKPIDLLNRVRRFMCYCRLSEIVDDSKKNKSAAHQREVFLFNDLLMITKLQNKSRKDDQYQCKYALALVDIQVKQFRTTNYEYGIHLLKRKTNESIIKLNALCQLDQKKFFFDLNDCIFESLEMAKINQAESLSFTHSHHTESTSPKVSPTNLANQKPTFCQKVNNVTPNPPRRQESLVRNDRPDVLKSMYQVRSHYCADSNHYRPAIQSGKPQHNNY